MSTAQDWRKAYARQADADLNTRNLLAGDASVPECHPLMFLQMACEKLTKAYLCRGGSDPKKLQSSHAYTAKSLPLVIRHQMDVLGLDPNRSRWLLEHFKHLAQEIEILAPAVDRDGQRPDNCEYPWEGSGARSIFLWNGRSPLPIS